MSERAVAGDQLMLPTRRDRLGMFNQQCVIINVYRLALQFDGDTAWFFFTFLPCLHSV